MKINKFHTLSVAVFYSVIAIWSGAQCMQQDFNDTNAYDYSLKKVCDDKFLLSGSNNLGVTSFIQDCKERDGELNSIKAIKVQTGFITDDGFKSIIREFQRDGFLKNLQILDLSFNRATANIFIDGDFTNNLEKMLERETFMYFDIHGNYAASIDGKEYFSNLKIKNLTKIIWIHANHLAGLGWISVVNGVKEKTFDEVKQIMEAHYKYYDLVKDIKYNDSFNIKTEKEQEFSSLIKSEEAWQSFLGNLQQEIEKKNISPKGDLGFYSDPALKYQIPFAMDYRYIGHNKARLEIAKKYLQYPSREEVLCIVAPIFHGLANDPNVEQEIRGEAAYNLSSIILDYGNTDNFGRPDELLNLSRTLKYEPSSEFGLRNY